MKRKIEQTQYLLPDKLKRSSAVPLYSQIYAQLKREIALGDFRDGEKFYSYRELKQLYKVELRTIASAVELLVRDRLVEKRAARGIYVNRCNACQEVGNIWFAVIGYEGYHPFYFNVLNGLICEAEKFGLRVMVKLSGGSEDFLEWFEPHPGEGLILTGEFDNSLLQCASAKCNGSMVIIGNYENIENYSVVKADYSSGFQQALSLAYNRNCSNYMLITGDAQRPISRELYRTVEHFCSEHRCRFHFAAHPDEDGYASLAATPFTPDCVIMTEPAYTGVLRYMFENDLHCPEDIFLIRYGKESCDRSTFDYASVDLEGNGQDFGKAALDMLLRSSKEKTAIPIACKIREQHT